MRNKLILLILCLLISVPCYATDYYVDTATGDNGDSGLTSELAWATLTYACANVPSGSHTVHVEAGTYNERITESTSGSGVGSEIWYKGENGWVKIYGMTVSGNYIKVTDFWAEDDDKMAPCTWATADWGYEITGDYIVLQDCYSTLNGYAGMQITGSHVTITGHESYQDGGTGINIVGTNVTVEESKIWDVRNNYCGDDGDGIKIITNSASNSGIIIRHNQIISALYSDLTGGPHCDAIQFANTNDTGDAIIDGNWIDYTGCGNYSGQAYSKFLEAEKVPRLTVINNVVQAYEGIGSWDPQTTNDGWVVYNNVFVHDSTGLGQDASCDGNGTAIVVGNGSDDWKIKNNIFVDWPANHLSVGSGNTYDFDYNCYYDSDLGDPNCTGSYCENTNDLYATDPKFTDYLGDDFTLASDSTLIGAGVDLGNGLLYGLDPTSTWPDNVKEVNQDDYGDWEIGAYAYIEAAELGGPGTIAGGGSGSIAGGGSGSTIGTAP